MRVIHSVRKQFIIQNEMANVSVLCCRWIRVLSFVWRVIWMSISYKAIFGELFVICAIWSASYFVTSHGNIHNPILGYLYTQPHLRLQIYLRLVPNHLLLGIPWPRPAISSTPFTQDDDLAAICKIGQIATDRRWVVERSLSAVAALQITVRSPRSPRSPPSFEHAKKAQWGRRGNTSPEHRSKRARGTRSIAAGSLTGYA